MSAGALPPTGKTMGDVLDGILMNPRRWLALMGLLTGLCGLVMLVLLVFTRLFGVETKEVRFGSTNSHIVLASVEKRSGNGEFIVIVNPEGWQQTAIEVHPGDHLSFYANGKICIDMRDILEKVDRRIEYENRVAAKEHIKRDDPSEQRVPEDYFKKYFTNDQLELLAPNRPWVDPDGFDLAKYRPSFESRRSRYLLPEANAAGLVAAVKDGSGEAPARSDAFFVGKSKEDYPISRAGWLWFTVNDVQYSDSASPNLF